MRSRRLRAERTELIGWLAGAVAHDVNNVLTAIAGYAELIESDLDPLDPRAADAAGIRDAVLRAGGLVRQLLTVGRRHNLRLEPLDASDLTAGLLPLISSVCGDPVNVQLLPCPHPAIVMADRSLLEQALLNLAVNARDAMPDGGTLTIRVSVGQGAIGDDVAPAGTEPGGEATTALPPAEEVLLSVEDTGVGIEAAVLPHVFEPYFSTKSPEHGSGIGLSAVEEAAIQCGGVVTVDSRPGAGTRFTIHLPRSAVSAPVQAGRHLAGSRRTAGAARVRGGPETVLIVDGDPEVRLVLARLMRGLGYAVVDAATPRQAIALVEHAIDRLDLLVTEVSLPGIAGTDLAAHVRVRYPSLPVLFLSRAARSPGRAQTGARAGDRVLTKPFTIERLGAALRSLLDTRLPDAVEG